MQNLCPQRLLPRLDRLPARSACPRTDRWEAAQQWRQKQRDLSLEWNTIRADLTRSSLSPGEQEQISQIYQHAMEECRRMEEHFAP